jgi:hypothetical protein
MLGFILQPNLRIFSFSVLSAPLRLKNIRSVGWVARSKTQLTRQHPRNVGLSPDGEAPPTFFNPTYEFSNIKPNFICQINIYPCLLNHYFQPKDCAKLLVV